jgi:hypothetical protein
MKFDPEHLRIAAEVRKQGGRKLRRERLILAMLVGLLFWMCIMSALATLVIAALLSKFF